MLILVLICLSLSLGSGKMEMEMEMEMKYEMKSRLVCSLRFAHLIVRIKCLRMSDIRQISDGWLRMRCVYKREEKRMMSNVESSQLRTTIGIEARKLWLRSTIYSIIIKAGRKYLTRTIIKTSCRSNWIKSQWKPLIKAFLLQPNSESS